MFASLPLLCYLKLPLHTGTHVNLGAGSLVNGIIFTVEVEYLQVLEFEITMSLLLYLVHVYSCNF